MEIFYSFINIGYFFEIFYIINVIKICQKLYRSSFYRYRS